MSEQSLEDGSEDHFDPTAPDLLDAKGWELWLRMPAWTIKEFVCLMHSIDPDEAEGTTGFFREYKSISNGGVSRTMRILERAKYIKEISNTMVPVKFIKWAENHGLGIPNEMNSPILRKDESDQTGKSNGKLAPKRETSLYNVIYALACLKQYIPGKRSELPGTMKNLLDTKGIDETTQETIKSVLEEAFRRAKEQSSEA